MKVSKKSFIIGLLIGLTLLFSFVFSLPDGKLHIVFCDIGQGDAIYIRTSNGSDMLIDGGPNDKVLDCLGKHMPFYDRYIDVVVATHPENDHIKGLVAVFTRYKVGYFITSVIKNDSEIFKKLEEVVANKKIPIKNLYSENSFSFRNVKYFIKWPEKRWLSENLSPSLANSNVLENDVLGAYTINRSPNDFSFLLHLAYGEFDVLFTGDADSRVQPELLKRVDLPDVEVLKFPHHGSKYGVTNEFLDKVKPELAVISVGKNPWGHPTKEALKQLSDRGVETLRTDLDGDIEVVSDGKNWWVE